MEVNELLKLPFLLEKDEDGVWVANCPYFKGMYTQGYTKEELQDNIQDISNMYFDMIRDGEKPYKSPYIINVTYNKDGKITNNISKEIRENNQKEVIGIN